MNTRGGSRPGGDATARSWAGAWLAQPVTIAAIVVMVINDHVLKAEFGTWWTGKLSDVAGLVFFPALVGFVLSLVAPRLRADALLTLSLAVTAVGFTWVKATDQGAASASALLTALGWPSTILRDPTDLMALASLVLAAWVARRVLTTPDPSPKRGRWRVAVVAPVALLASVATGAPADPEATAIEQVDGTWVLQVEDGASYHETVTAAWSEGGWIASDADGGPYDPREGYERGTSPRTATLESCSEAVPQDCYRIMPDQLGVERSTDGGATWTVDWELDESTRRHLNTAYGRNPESPDVSTKSVAVIDTGDSYIVFAANGRDGLAERSADGSWERIGYDGVPGVQGFTLAPLPGEFGPSPQALVPVTLFWATESAGLVFLLAGCVGSWRTNRSIGSVIGGVAAGVPAVLLAVYSAALAYATFAPLAHRVLVAEAYVSGVLAVTGSASLLLLLLTALATTNFRWPVWHNIHLFALGAAVVSALIAGVLAAQFETWWAMAVSAGVVSLGASALAVWRLETVLRVERHARDAASAEAELLASLPLDHPSPPPPPMPGARIGRDS